MELLALAAWAELDELRTCCATFIEENLHHGHAAFMLEQSSVHDQDLFQHCLEFIAWNCTEVIETEGFFALSEGVLCKLLDSDELYMPNEIDLYHAIVEWGHRKVENNAKFGLPAVALKEIVAKPLKAVRMGMVNVRDLNSVVRKGGLARSATL